MLSNDIISLDFFYLKALQVIFPLVGLTITMETNTGQLVGFTVWTYR